MTIYVVTGRPRSGTSMMMNASIAGGMNGVYSARKNIDHGAYDPNPAGHFEVRAEDIDMNNYPACMEGKVFKRMHERLTREDILFQGHQMKGIFMNRDADEIAASWDRTFHTPFTPTWQYDANQGLANLQATFPDSDFIMVNYNDVIADPIGEFTKLAAWGWPIDVNAAATVVDASLYRHRKISSVVQFTGG